MPRAMGEAVDRLIVTNLKLWATQDVVGKAAESGEGLEAETVKRLHALNLERNSLMAEINGIMLRASQGDVDVESHIKIF